MIFDPSIWLITNCLYGLITGYCLYGDTPDCAFQCHCAVDIECSEGVCPSGCDRGPLGYDWGGPACQIGNVGLHKPANMTVEGDYAHLYPATAALDGVSPGVISSNCAHTGDPNNKSAEWWTDLGDIYKIYNITIYGRTDGAQYRLQQFNLTVYNRSDNEVLCAYHHDIIKTFSTITCNRPVIGRYVHFKRTGGPDISQVALCEIVIIGHKYIDCSHCPVRVTCNDVTGCTQCNGFYPPDCTQKCESGYYGRNCQQQCGHCKDEVTCENENGRCSNGCQLWWADNRCQTYVDNPDGTGKNISVRSEEKSSIEIEWQHFSNISDVLKPYYGYLIEYKADSTCGNYRKAGTVNYTSSPYWKIEKLRSDTNYSIQIKPFRMLGDHKDYGSAYPELQAMTKSAEPPQRNGTCQTSFSPLYMTVTIIIISVSLNIVLGILLWKSRRQQTKLRRHTKALNSTQTDSQTDHNTVSSNDHIELSPRILEYEQAENNGLAQYAAIKGDQTTYERLSDEVRAVYENRMMTGPYAELQK